MTPPRYPRRRRKPPGHTTLGGWGYRHQQRRKQLAPLVAAGQVDCARCGQRIEPGAEWHLDHTDDRRGYEGISHALCNLRAAGIKSTNGRRGTDVTRIWSRKWSDTADVGTLLHNEDGSAEIYDGFTWQPYRG